MNDYVALLIVIVLVAVACLLLGHPAWRKCRCGTQYCTGCGSKRQR